MPGGQETKSERAANHRAGERVVSLEVEVSALSILGKTFSLSRKLTAAQRSFRDWCSGTHVHWQATAEQFFFSKFNMHIMFI